MNRIRMSVTFDAETYQQLKNIADKNGISIAEVIRRNNQASLNNTVTVENLDLITRIIREQLKDVLAPSVERLAALSAKSCVQSSTAALLSAEAISRWVPADLQADVRDTYERARKKAVIYTKQKASSPYGDEADM